MLFDFNAITLWGVATLVFFVTFKGQMMAIQQFNYLTDAKPHSKNTPLIRLLIKKTSRVLLVAFSLYLASLLLNLSVFAESLLVAFCASALLYQVFKWFSVVFYYYDAPEKMAVHSTCHPQDKRWVCRR